jgi:hypothetical protein
MKLEVVAGATEGPLKREVVTVVRRALRAHAAAGPWKLRIRRRRRGYLVDLTNPGGVQHRWVLEHGDPVAAIIHTSLT